MPTDNIDFLKTLEALANEQNRSFFLSKRSVSFKPLTTLQLRKLIETVVNNPLDQTTFNVAATNILKESCKEELDFELNVFDRLLFLLQARIDSISNTVKIQNEETVNEVNIQQVLDNLKASLQENEYLLKEQTVNEGNINITFGPVLLKDEILLHEQVYSKAKFKTEDIEGLRQLVGEVFVHEITKVIRKVEAGNASIEFSKLSFPDRISITENLSANIIQKVIEYVEQTKQTLEKALTYNDHVLAVDGTLFALK